MTIGNRVREVEKEILKIYKVKNVKDFQDTYRLKLTLGTTYNGNVRAYLSQVDPFHKHYTRVSSCVMELDELEGIPSELDKNSEKLFKSMVTRRVKQQRDLEVLREIALGKISKFIESTFKVDPRLIDDNDIKWAQWSYFTFLGYNFAFTGKFVDKSFEVEEYGHKKYASMYKMVVDVKTFYERKAHIKGVIIS